VLLTDLGVRSADLVDHYSDFGILPRAARITAYDLRYPDQWHLTWSIHMCSGSVLVQAALFLAAAAFACCLLVGYRTRLATAASWVLLASLHSRLPVVLQAGDMLLRMLLFWSMFVPLGAAWSADRQFARRHSTDGPSLNAPIMSAGTAALLLQLASVYLFSAAAKWDQAWHPQYDAFYYALNLRSYAKPTGRWLLEYPELLRWLTAAVWWLEWIGPIAVFLPWRTGMVRLLIVAAMACFHLGSALCLHLGLLPFVSIIGWMIFLPPSFWDRTERLLQPLLTRVSMPLRACAGWLGRWLGRPSPPYWTPGLVMQATIIALVLYVGTGTYLQLEKNNEPAGWPAWFDAPNQLLRLGQSWFMFAPRPPSEDSWLALKGVLKNGREVNLWQPNEPLPGRDSATASAAYPNHRWRKYFANIRDVDDPELTSCLSDWLRWRWNRLYAEGDPDQEVRLVEITLYRTVTPSPGNPSSNVESETIWSWDYEAH
jgi:hypothetical protein